MSHTGDQSGNLLWRLETGGEFPTKHMPKTVVILIGTNDLTYADCDNESRDILNAAPGIISRHVPPHPQIASDHLQGWHKSTSRPAGCLVPAAVNPDKYIVLTQAVMFAE